MPTIRVFLDESDQDERKRRRRKAGGVILVAVAAALALAPRPEPPPPPEAKSETKTIYVETPVPSIRYYEPLGPWPQKKRTRVTEAPPNKDTPKEDKQPSFIVINDPSAAPFAWPELPQVTRKERKGQDVHTCNLNPRVEPPHIHFRGPGRKRVTVSNPHDVPIRLTAIELASAAGVPKGYELSGADKCTRLLEPEERCTFVVKALAVADYTPVARVSVAHGAP